MGIGKSEYRRVLGHFATGVTVVTTCEPDGTPAGLTANAVTALSLEPPLLLVCLDKSSDCHPAFAAADAFTVNILAAEQEEISQRFASKGCDKFAGLAHRPGRHGCARLEGALAYAECRVVERHDGGDHTILVGEIEEAGAGEADPLLFFRGGYRRLAP